MAETPPTVDQPTGRPTNKMMVAVGAGLLTNLVIRVIDHYGLSEWFGDDMEMLRQFLGLAFSALIGFVIAYQWVKDRGNQVQEVKALEAAVIRAGATIPPKPEGNSE